MFGNKAENVESKEQSRGGNHGGTHYGACSERLTVFGGLLALVKFLDLLKFEDAFDAHYVHPKREPRLGAGEWWLEL